MGEVVTGQRISAHQHGRPPVSGEAVRRQLMPSETLILNDLTVLIGRHQTTLDALDPLQHSADYQRVLNFKKFCEFQLRLAQGRFGQPVDPEF